MLKRRLSVSLDLRPAGCAAQPPGPGGPGLVAQLRPFYTGEPGAPIVLTEADLVTAAEAADDWTAVKLS